MQSTNKSDNTAPHSCTSSVISKQGGTKKTTSNKQSSCKGKAKSSEQQPIQEQNQLGNNASASNASCKNKTKLDDTLLRLLSKMPKKNAVDASYLLEHDKRPRKRKVW